MRVVHGLRKGWRGTGTAYGGRPTVAGSAVRDGPPTPNGAGPSVPPLAVRRDGLSAYSVLMASMDAAMSALSEAGSGAVPAAALAACWPASEVT